MQTFTKPFIKTHAALLMASFLAGSHTASSQQDSLTPYTSADQVPQNAIDLWAGYDSKVEPLDVKIHQEWKQDGVVSRLITFKVGTFKGTDSRIAAYYCFPENGKKNPAFVWSHGGGQCADRNRGHYFATQGFATVDINWLGRPLEGAKEGLTDWGKIDPTQGPNFYAKALRKHFKSSFHPDEHSVDPIISPRNSNWFMLSLAGRRALTFLEQQPEVDATKLGFTGFSMGGTITSMTAIDKRLKAVAAGLYATLQAQINAMQDFAAKQGTRDQIKVTIHHYLWDEKTGLPGSYSRPEIVTKADAVFAHLVMQARQTNWNRAV